MTKQRKLVVVGIFGTRLDAGHAKSRWNRWRPTVSVCQHEDLLVDRLELIHQPGEEAVADTLVRDIASVSPETEVRLHPLKFNDAWDFEEVFAALHHWSRGMNFRPDTEDYLIHITTGSHVQQICLFLLAESRHIPGQLLQSSPPLRAAEATGAYRIIDLDLSKYDALATRFAEEQQEGLSFLKSGIETRSRTFNTLIERIERVAIASSAPLLITGPTGAGKSQLAARIFELKRRRGQVRGSFVEVNCATLRGDQAMSSLFGHAKGAFTGATTPRAGLLMAADQGILFLDEIGELGRDEQATLLRAIEEKRFLPVGCDRETASDFQLIAGTNRDLAADVHAGRFREDLLARINLWTFRLPALAERREDIEPNIQYELDRYAARTGQQVTINKEARQKFLQFAQSPAATWSANFRDLNAAITRMATLAPSGRITTDEVHDEIARLESAWQFSGSDSGKSSRDDLSLLVELLGDEKVATIDLFDRAQLAAVVRICRESASLSDAGRKLFAISRLAKSQPNDADRLRKFLARFELSWTDFAASR
ncbi:Sigma 54 interacting domain protein [Pirellula staleyi DSM 6068]|uniref:Sigma 54 interacting domain protein n=1 Tax=Pirellula staleyi (strain ATCC 27377 / DSM 6068 / ICPB 4128) TaxID=530564 RepID=D2R2E4_PIRSD|nr:RNA repair transcriptional activator RtcR [Pirellula staleyi]ADB15053.1 Sigma 54 interacting domain protein [Pirellula staleyi DSM 6068]